MVSASLIAIPSAPLLICVFGRFSLLKLGQRVTAISPHMRGLLHQLALEEQHCLPREVILEAHWPNQDSTLARQSLNSLIYSMRRIFGDVLGGAAPVVYADDGYYQLNLAAGVAVDVMHFDAMVDQYELQSSVGNRAEAVRLSEQAIALYQGDLQLLGSDLRAIVERER